MKLNISITGIILTFLSIQFIGAQDIHLSQYHFDRLMVNPALTGIFNGNRQVSLIHKQQYFSVPVDYLTFSGSYDTKFLKTQNQKGFFSAGVLFNYDKAGDAGLALGSLTINGSYTRAITRSFFIGAGAYVGGGQRRFDDNPENLDWENQWTGTIFDHGIPSGETYSRSNFLFFDVGGGVNLRLQGRDRTKLDVGVGAFHLTRPDFAFYETDDVKLPIRTSLYAMGILKLFSRLDLYANGLLQNQGPYEETVLGGGIIIHISNKLAREVELHLGAANRLDDAIIPMIAVGYDGWKAGFAYDINTSGFKAATGKAGGPEFFANYTWKRLWPLEQTRVCSIF
jgi:type IX secretion system PorP/SprF family membrane protein